MCLIKRILFLSYIFLWWIGSLSFFCSWFLLVKDLAGWETRQLPHCLIPAAALWVGEPLEAWQSLGRGTMTLNRIHSGAGTGFILCYNRIWITDNIAIRKLRNYFYKYVSHGYLMEKDLGLRKERKLKKRNRRLHVPSLHPPYNWKWVKSNVWGLKKLSLPFCKG